MATEANLDYHLLDEPSPGRLANLVVNPFWPVLALMLTGGIIGWPWLVLNSLAIGSATKAREIALVITSIVLVVLLLVGIAIGYEQLQLFPKGAMPYLMIGLPALKMGFAFIVYRLQTRSFELYEYFGGRVRNGAPIVFLSFFAEDALKFGDASGLWQLVLL